MTPYAHTYDLHLDRARTLLADAEARRLRTRPALGERLARRLAGRGRPALVRPIPGDRTIPAVADGGAVAPSSPSSRRELVGAAAGADVR